VLFVIDLNLGRKPPFSSILKNIIRDIVPSFILLKRRASISKGQQKRRLTRRKLLRFEIHLVDHCNLNCKGCDHFSPIAEKSFIDINIFENCFHRIAELTNGRIEEIQLLGGEPLLHGEINELLDIAGKYFHSNIKIVTNGLLLLKQTDDFWQKCKKNNIAVVITNYPVKLDHARIKKTAKRHGVRIEYTGGDRKELYAWSFDIKGTQNIYESFSNCSKANTCIHLYDGKLYTCPTIPCIRFLNNYFNQEFKISENDYIDIYEVKDIGEVFDFLCKPVPFCRYCNISKIKTGLKWDVSKKDISEWLDV
jgi:hypothetical protein